MIENKIRRGQAGHMNRDRIFNIVSSNHYSQRYAHPQVPNEPQPSKVYIKENEVSSPIPPTDPSANSVQPKPYSNGGFINCISRHILATQKSPLIDNHQRLSNHFPGRTSRLASLRQPLNVTANTIIDATSSSSQRRDDEWWMMKKKKKNADKMQEQKNDICDQPPKPKAYEPLAYEAEKDGKQQVYRRLGQRITRRLNALRDASVPSQTQTQAASPDLYDRQLLELAVLSKHIVKYTYPGSIHVTLDLLLRRNSHACFLDLQHSWRAKDA